MSKIKTHLIKEREALKLIVMFCSHWGIMKNIHIIYCAFCGACKRIAKDRDLDGKGD